MRWKRSACCAGGGRDRSDVALQAARSDGSSPERASRMLMIALTVDHDIAETLHKIITPSARVSTIMFCGMATGTLARAATAALGSSNFSASANDATWCP